MYAAGEFFHQFIFGVIAMRPKAYAPEAGYRFQLLCRNTAYGREWEHCDYARDRQERNYLRTNYQQAYGAGWEFMSILLPAKYWPRAVAPVLA